MVPPKPVVPEATAPPGDEPTPPAPEPFRLRPRPNAGAPIALAEEASQTFVFDVQGTRSRDRCAIPGSWTTRPRYLDVQAEGPTWSYTPDFDAAGERLKEIKVVASDGDAVKAEIQWRVKVLEPNRPPRLVAAMLTTQTSTVKSGETVRFSVQGKDADRDDALAYVSSLDAARMAEGERFELKSGESKDVDLLIQLGELTPVRAPQLRGAIGRIRRFPRRGQRHDDPHRCRFSSGHLPARGHDRWRTLPHPGLKEVLLEKQANGRLTRRR